MGQERTMTLILTILAVLLTVTPASAGWILYRHQNGGWQPAGTYDDQKVCEAAAKELADSQKTWAGCAPPSPVTTVQPPVAGEKGPATKQWEESEAARAKKKADAAQRMKEQRERLCREIVTECQTYQGRQSCTSRPRC
jgi:hypothetical protein